MVARDVMRVFRGGHAREGVVRGEIRRVGRVRAGRRLFDMGTNHGTKRHSFSSDKQPTHLLCGQIAETGVDKC